MEVSRSIPCSLAGRGVEFIVTLEAAFQFYGRARTPMIRILLRSSERNVLGELAPYRLLTKFAHVDRR